jgi:hypothetical protein
MRRHDGAKTTTWLHNMSVPSHSTLAVERQWLGGRCFDVRPGHLTSSASWIVTGRWAARALRDHGSSALLALLLEPPEPTDSWQTRVTRARRRVQRQGNVRARLDEALDATLRESGIPQRVGVFMPRGDVGAPGAIRLGFAASIAALGHRSGPLYLPARQVDGSLIELADLLLVFPDEEAGDTATRQPVLP